MSHILDDIEMRQIEGEINALRAANGVLESEAESLAAELQQVKAANAALVARATQAEAEAALLALLTRSLKDEFLKIPVAIANGNIAGQDILPFRVSLEDVIILLDDQTPLAQLAAAVLRAAEKFIDTPQHMDESALMELGAAVHAWRAARGGEE